MLELVLGGAVSAGLLVYGLGRQVARVAAARSIPSDRLRELLAAHTKGRLLGLIGEPRVNLLALNLELDAQTHHTQTRGAQTQGAKPAS